MADPYRQSLSAPPPFERTPPTLHQPVRATLAGWLVRNLLRPAWSWRVEAGAALLLAFVWIEPIPAGDLMRVQIPAGRRTSDLADAAETVAACLAVREIRVNRDLANARFAEVTIVRRDPLSEYPSLGWPELLAPRLSLWEPIPVGVDEDGIWVTVSLPERNVLIGGEPGAGKSVAASMLVASAALDPEVDLILLDGKRVELATWAGCADRIVGPSLDDAIDTLREVQA